MHHPPYPGSAWLGFGVGIMVGIGISGGWGYGCGWGGGGNNVYINHNNNFIKTNNIRTGNINNGNINGGRSDWNHNPSHRGAAPDANQNTASKFGGTARGDSPSARTTGAGNAGANRPSAGRHGRQPALDHKWRRPRGQPQRAANLVAQRQRVQRHIERGQPRRQH